MWLHIAQQNSVVSRPISLSAVMVTAAVSGDGVGLEILTVEVDVKVDPAVAVLVQVPWEISSPKPYSKTTSPTGTDSILTNRSSMLPKASLQQALEPQATLTRGRKRLLLSWHTSTMKLVVSDLQYLIWKLNGPRTSCRISIQCALDLTLLPESLFQTQRVELRCSLHYSCRQIVSHMVCYLVTAFDS